MKNNFDLEKMQELWDRQSQSLQGRQLISDEEIAAALTPRRSWLPKAAAAAALLMMAGGAALWLSQPQQETPTAATAMLTTPQPITQAEVLPASPEKVILREHTRPLLAENTAPAQVQEPAATNAMAETAPSTVQDLVVREAAISEEDKKAAPMPTVIETHRLVTIGATRPEAVPVIIEGNNLVMLSDEKPEYHIPRFEKAPKEPERPTFHNCVIEPLLASII